MKFDLANIRKQIEQAPLSAPLPLELGMAAVCDLWRLANLAPAGQGQLAQFRPAVGRAGALSSRE